MKKFLSMLAIAAMFVSFVACDDEEGTNPDPEPTETEVEISGKIEENTTWTSDKIYILKGRVIVTDGVTLTIEPGTIIKGGEGEGANASVLMIARGGKLDARGTAEEPIIMTSILDDIEIGQKSGSNLNEDDRGKWGGLVILGYAPISVNGSDEKQIEGVPAEEPLGLYGGNESNDNSGTITYVSIRHGGAVLGPDSEINGLTLGGVGTGTTISNIEIFANSDDGVEFFGGTVNVSDIIVSFQGDDAIDIDQAYSGTVDGFAIIHGGDTDEAFEVDGPEGAANADGKFVVKNGTVKADPTRAGDKSSLGDFKSKAQGTIQNVVFSGYPEGKKIKIAASYETDCSARKSNALLNLVEGNLIFEMVEIEGYGVSVYDAAADDNNPGCSTDTDVTAAAQAIVSEQVNEANIPTTSSWSWTLTFQKELL